MKYEVDGWNNFCRVFELPTDYPHDYCFGGGHPVNFQMVDWFNPVTEIGFPAISKKAWKDKFGTAAFVEVDADELTARLIPFLKQKRYVKPGRQYLALTDFGMSIRFDGPPEDKEHE